MTSARSCRSAGESRDGMEEIRLRDDDDDGDEKRAGMLILQDVELGG